MLNMKRAMTAALCLAMMMVFATAGWSAEKEADKAGDVKQDTPQNTMKKFYLAMTTEDKAAFTECMNIPEGMEAFVGVFFDFTTTIMKFNQKVKDVHGQEGLDALNKKAGGMAKGPSFDKKWLDGLTYEIKGDKATVVDPAQKNSKEMPLIKKDDKWVLDMASEMKPQSEKAQKQMETMFVAMAKAYSDSMDDVNKETPVEDLQKKVQERMMAAMFGAMKSAAE